MIDYIIRFLKWLANLFYTQPDMPEEKYTSQKTYTKSIKPTLIKPVPGKPKTNCRKSTPGRCIQAIHLQQRKVKFITHT